MVVAAAADWCDVVREWQSAVDDDTQITGLLLDAKCRTTKWKVCTGSSLFTCRLMFPLSKWKKTLAYLLVLPGSRARIVRCGGRYDPQLFKRSSEWVSQPLQSVCGWNYLQTRSCLSAADSVILLHLILHSQPRKHERYGRSTSFDQCHQNWHQSKARVRFSISLALQLHHYYYFYYIVFRKKHPLLFSCIPHRKSNQFEWKFQTK